MAIDGIKKELNEIFPDDKKKELNKIFPDDKKLNTTDLKNEVLLAKIYCFRYIIDQAAFSAFIIRCCSLKEIEEVIDRKLNKEFDTHFAEESLERRFKDPKRNKYLVSDLGPNSLLTYALNVIRGQYKDMAPKIEKTLEYIRSWQCKNNILDEILAYNHLDYSGNRGDIGAKIAKMRSRGSSVNKSDNDALLDLGLDLSRELQGKFKIIRDDSLPPAAAGAAGGRVLSSGSSSPPVAAGAAGANLGQGRSAELIPPQLDGPFGGGSVPNSPPNAEAAASGANSGQGPSAAASGAAGANSGQGPSPVAAGAAGANSGQGPSAADEAINNIFKAFGVYKYNDYNERISGLIDELLSIQEIIGMDVKPAKIYIIDSLDLDAIRSDDRFGSITCILDPLLEITDGPIKVENAQVFKTDTIGAAGVRVSPSRSSSPPVAAGAAGGRVSSSGQGLPAELIPPKLIGAFGGGSVPNSSPNAEAAASGANSGQGPSAAASGAAGANSGQGPSPVAAGAAGGRVSSLVVEENDEAIAAVRKIAICLDLLVLKDGNAVFQEFLDEISGPKSFQVSAQNREAYENALDVLRKGQDYRSKFIVELLEANVSGKDAQFEAAAAGGRVSPSGKGLSGELRPPELTGPSGGGSVPNSPPNAAVAAAGANSGQGLSPVASGAAGVRVSPSRSSSPPVAAGAAGGRVSSSGQGPSAAEFIPPPLDGPFGGNSVVNGKGAFSGAAGANSGQGPSPVAAGAAGANSGQGLSAVAAGAAGGSVSPSYAGNTEKPNREAIPAIRQIAGFLGRIVLKDGEEIFEEFRDIILQSLETDSLQISAENRDAYEDALDVLREKQDDRSKFIVELLEANVPDKNVQFEAAAAGGRVSPSRSSSSPVAGNVVTENKIKKAYYDILRGFMPDSYPNRKSLDLDFQEISISIDGYKLLTFQLIDDYDKGSLRDYQLFSADDSGALLKKDENGHTVFSDEFNKNLEILNNSGHTKNGKNFSDLALNMIRDASQQSIGAPGSASTVAAGGRVSPLDAGNTEKPNREAIAAIKTIAGVLGVDVVQDDKQLRDDFLGKILERKSFQISAQNRHAYENALDVLREDTNYQVVFEVLNQPDKIQYYDSLSAAGSGAAAAAAGANLTRSPSHAAGNVVKENDIKTKIDNYIEALEEGSHAPGQDQAFKNNLISFLTGAKDRIKDEPLLLKKLDLFFQSADKIGGSIVLAHAAESKNINSKYVLEKDGKKVNLGVDCIESRLMDKGGINSFNYIIGAKTIGVGAKTIGLQTKLTGNYVLVDPNDRSANESYAPYAVPDDDVKVDIQKSLYKLNLLDGISQMAQAISDGKTDIRVTCVEGKGRSVTLALLFAKICKGDYSLNEIEDKALIEKLARDRNSDYNYVTTGSHKCNDYQNSAKFKMLTEVLKEFQERLKARGDDSMFFKNVKQVADDMIQKIQGELTTPSAKSIVSRYANQPEMKRAPVIGP